MPVNLVTGSPQVSIPLYTLEYAGMTLPISLEYDASGVKVESIASSVGLNWSLNLGGNVSRIVKGAPDEGPNNGLVYPQSNFPLDGFYRNYGLSNLNSSLAAYNTNAITAVDVCGNFQSSQTSLRMMEYGKWIQDSNNGSKDSQPDLFYFSTPEGGSKFVFNEQRQIVYLENTDYIIKEDFVPNYFRTWTATSPSGIKYKYGLITGGDIGANNNVELNATSASSNDLTFNFSVTSWFLSEISSFKNNKKIQIDYIDNNYHQTVLNNPNYNTWACVTTSVPSYQVYPLISANWDPYQNPEGLYNNFASNPYEIPNAQYQCNLSGTGVATIAVPLPPGYVNNDKLFVNNVKSKLVSKITAGLTEIYFTYSSRDDLLMMNGITAKKLDMIVINYNGECIKSFNFNYSTSYSSETSNITNVTDYERKRLILNNVNEYSCDNGIVKPYTFTYNTQTLPNRLSFAQDKWGYYNGKVTNTFSLFPSSRLFDNNLWYFANRDVNFGYAKALSLEKITYPTKGTVNFEYESHLLNTPTNYVFDQNSLGTLVSVNSPVDSSLSQNSTSFVYTPVANQTLSLNATLYYNPVGYSGCTNSSGLAATIIDSNGNNIYWISYSEIPSGNISTTIKKPIDFNLLIPGATYTLRAYSYGYLSHCNFSSVDITKHNITPTYEVGGLRIKRITNKDYDLSVAKVINYTYFNPKLIKNPKPFFKIDFNFINNFNDLSYVLDNTTVSHFINLANTSQTTPIDYRTGYYYFLTNKGEPFETNFMGPILSYGKVIESDGNGSIEHYFNDYKTYYELNGGATILFPSPPKFQSILAGEKSSIIQKNTVNTAINTKNFNYNYTTQNTTVKGIVMAQINIGTLTKVYTIQGQTKTLNSEVEILNLNGQSVTTTKNYQFNGNGHYQPTKITTTDNLGNQAIITNMYYPGDLLSGIPEMSNLLLQNRKSTPIKTEGFRGTTKMFEEQTSYKQDLSTNNFLLPKSIYSAKFPNTFPLVGTPINSQLERKVTSDFYDDSGNLTQYTKENGVTVSIIWGYNKTQPIAEIENATNVQITTALGVTNVSSLSEINLASINALRTNNSFINSMITTYTYIPLIGVYQITDPKGDVITYIYDSFNRLQKVKDKNGNILSENQYHYKN